MFQVGYSRVDITPTESVPLAGFGNTSFRMSTAVKDPIYTTCTALTGENGVTVLLFHNDLISSPDFVFDPVREAVSAATGVPVDHITVSATHTHSGPDLRNLNEPSIERYNESLSGLLTKCAVEALADRKPAKAYGGKVLTQGLNFERHYILVDGHYRGDNFGVQYEGIPIEGHVTEADGEMRLVKFVREGGKDVILVNWQIHPMRTGAPNKFNISGDIISTFREEMEAALDCHFTYFTGGAGNIAHYTLIPGEPMIKTYREHGKALTDYALTAQYEPLALGPIRVTTVDRVEPFNRPDEAQLARAKEVAQYWETTNDYRSSIELAVKNGFSSQYHAQSAIGRYYSGMETFTISMTAISFGDFGFATVPHEMFDTNAKYVRDFSPFKLTFVVSCTNRSIPYIPSAYAFAHQCYESAVTYATPGAGERVAQNLVQMLKRLKDQ